MLSDIKWNDSTQLERDDWYRDRKVPCLGDEGNTQDRCGYLKRKYEEWGFKTPFILDFPCHDGFVTRGFLGKGASLLGFDIGVDAIKMATEVAKQKYPRDKFNWDYIVSSTNDFDWHNYQEEFDIVVCYEFIEHILREDVANLITVMHAVTRLDGYVTISTPQKSGKYGENGDDETHINCYTADDLRMQIKQTIGVEPDIEETEDFIFVSWRKE